VDHDLIVVGGGAAAFAAASEGAHLGFDVLLALPGGGEPQLAYPRLSLAFATRMLGERRAALGPGARVSWEALARSAQQAVAAHVRMLRREAASARVRAVACAPRIRAPGEIEIGSEVHRAAAVVIATGTRPRRPLGFPFDDRVVCDPETLLRLRRPPRKLAVIGASEDGCELSCLFAAVGASVLLVDRRARLLRAVDRDVLRVLHEEMRLLGIEVVLDEVIRECRVETQTSEPHAELVLASGRVETCDRVAVCAGRLPNLSGLGLEALRLDTDPRGFLLVDEWGRTSRPGLLATGDVAGVPAELGLQVQRARALVRHVAGLDPALPDYVPSTIYTLPQVATAGLSEEACRRLGIACAVGVAPYPAACAAGDERGGLLKLVADATSRRVLGVHVIGPSAGDTLHLALALLRGGDSLECFGEAVLHLPGPADALRLAACEALAAAPRGEQPAVAVEEPARW
jgi:pyruvate/2-oxoglutarate dehydrogenase complex dihydrolipoamide dehydrogenase (E3) component